VAWFGRGGRGARQHRAGGGLGVDRVGLASLPAEPPVRPVDLNNRDAVVEQVAGQAGAVAAGAFHPDQVKAAVASQPAA
jgi:alpha-D-ribose 1-methylphosphonate 5-triphosphate synthase subunit PhnL